VSILCDIQGPKIRTGKVKEAFNVDVGDHIDVTADSVLGTPECVQIKYPHMMEDLDVGDKIFINDGIVKLRVEAKKARSLACVVEAGGQISDHKGCNIPKGKLSLNIITEKDKVRPLFRSPLLRSLLFRASTLSPFRPSFFGPISKTLAAVLCRGGSVRRKTWS
jgi:pyruvate kinase